MCLSIITLGSLTQRLQHHESQERGLPRFQDLFYVYSSRSCGASCRSIDRRQNLEIITRLGFVSKPAWTKFHTGFHVSPPFSLISSSLLSWKIVCVVGTLDCTRFYWHHMALDDPRITPWGYHLSMGGGGGGWALSAQLTPRPCNSQAFSVIKTLMGLSAEVGRSLSRWH